MFGNISPTRKGMYGNIGGCQYYGENKFSEQESSLPYFNPVQCNDKADIHVHTYPRGLPSFGPIDVLFCTGLRSVWSVWIVQFD